MEERGLSDSVEYVGFWKRVLASLIDTLWVTLITLPLLARIYGWSYLEQRSDRWVQGPGDFVISYLLPALLIVGFWYYRLATPGKMVIKAVIVDQESLKRPSTKNLVIRYLGYYISAFALGLGFVWVAFDKKKQGWHDKLAGTVVVSSKGLREEPIRSPGRRVYSAPMPEKCHTSSR